MDNRITKKRLNHMFSYEWVAIILVIVAVIFVWEMAYSFFSVKLTAGQRFRIFYDYKISANQAEAFLDVLETNNTFSYDVLEVKYEQLLENSEVLYQRNQLGMTDAVITDVKNTGDETTHFRAAEIIDQYAMYAFDDLILQAKEYVEGFKTDGTFDDYKIQTNFLSRMKGDNRFRTEAQKSAGIEWEKTRLEKLEEDIATVEKLFEYDAELKSRGEESVFYSYKRYSQTLSETTNDTAKEYYQTLIESETEKNYGLKLWLLPNGGGKKNPSNYFKSTYGSNASCEDVVMMIFDVKSFQPDLQYETVSMLATVINEFSLIAD